MEEMVEFLTVSNNGSINKHKNIEDAYTSAIIIAIEDEVNDGKSYFGYEIYSVDRSGEVDLYYYGSPYREGNSG